MLRCLYSAATGMQAQAMNVDVISHNLANVNTTGFKKSRAEFEDLLYQTVREPGAKSTINTDVPSGIQIGLGARPVSVNKIYTQGNFKETGGSLDLVIEGDGFFQVTMPDGTVAYTRAGSFSKDSTGRVVTSDGYPMEPPLTIPADATSVTIGTDGTNTVTSPGSTAVTEIGTIQLAKFINPSGLKSIGKNLFTQTSASGDAVLGTPGLEGFGTISQGFVEISNVDIVEELIEMIVAQRAYETNSRSVRTADEMLNRAINLGR